MLSADLAEKTVDLTFKNRTVSVTFPSIDEGLIRSNDHSGNVIGIGMPWIDMHMTVTADVDANKFAESAVEGGTRYHLVKACQDVAQRIATAVQIRQPWIAIAGSQPAATIGSVVDVSTGAKIPLSFRPPGRGMVLSHDYVDESLVHRAISESGPSPADLMLAQARNVGHFRTDPYAAHAVILAAVACELRIKERLRDVTNPEITAILELLVPEQNPSLVQMYEILDSVSKLALGRSLKEDNLELYGKTRALFTARNHLVHRGKIPPNTEAKNHVSTALKFFEWVG